MSGELEKQLAEAEKRRQIVEELRNQAPSLAEKLRFASEQLKIQEDITRKTEEWLERFLERYQEAVNRQMGVRRKLLELMPSVVAEIKE